MLVSLAPAILATEADSGGSEQANVADEYREFYNNLMACTTLEEANALLNTLSDEEFEVFVNSLSEDEYNALNEHMNALIAAAEDEGIVDYVYSAVNFTNVAPLVEWPAVTPTRGAYSLNATGDGEQAGDDNGLVLAKNAQYNPETGRCTITLEAYTKGTVTTEVKNVPTDIVLVLDQSGSMNFCMVCGEEIHSQSDTHYKYVETTPIIGQGTYYIKDDVGYIQVYYCDGEHSWYGHCDGGAGWYTSSYWRNHSKENRIIPKTDTDSNGIQFYVKEQEACTSRLAALKSAVNIFVDEVAQKAKGADGQYGTGDDVAHRIAIVGFASNSSNGNTELLSTQNATDYSSANDANYHDALVPACSADGNVNPRLSTAIVRLDSSGDTYLEYGMDMANKIFAQYPITADDTSGRQRVVVVFTDGYPAPSGTNDFKYSMANNAIQNANTTKQTYKATVYTVGVFNTADPTADIETNFAMSDGWSDGWGGSGNNLTEQQEAVAANRYMHYVSSNFPGATSLNQGGSMNPNANPFAGGDSYYLSAGDTTVLNSIFTQISNQISSPAINLGTETVVRDILSPYFNLPVGTNAGSIKLYTADYNGTTFEKGVPVKPTDGITATVDIETETIEVSGFDFTKNFVSETAKPGETYGKKLIIEFDTVLDRSSTFGGNGIPTNADASGVYSGDECVEYFVSPTVDIPIDFDFGTSDSTIYLSRNANAQSLVDVLDDYTPNGTNNAHVNIVFTITRGGNTATLTYNAGDRVGTWSGDSLSSLALTDCTDFKVSCTVTPINEGTVSGKVIGRKTATIHVLRPTIVWEDIEVYLGDTVDLDTAFDSVSWTDANATTHTAPEATGTAPVIAYNYSIYDGGLGSIDGGIYTPARTDACPINVSVTVDGMSELDEYVTSYSSCGTHPIGSHTLSVNSPEFYVHVKTCSITITKLGYDENLQNGGQTFLFEVVDSNNNAVVATVAIGENGSATVVGLPVGTYTVREVNAWSWRYKAHDDVTVTLNTASPTGTAEFENVVANSHWLSGDSFMRNLFSLLTQG